MTKAQEIQKKLQKKEREVVLETKKFLNSQGVEFNKWHKIILQNAMREMAGFAADLIRPEFEKLKKRLKC